jgi:hypothetical protein
MKRPTKLATMLGLCLLPALASVAVAEPMVSEGDKFAMSPVEGGFLRLDKQTGAVAMCAKSGSDWACKPVDDQTANGPETKISHLEAENRELKGRIKELQDLLETHSPGPSPLEGPMAEGPPGGKAQLPTDEEVDQALDYMTRVYKKIRDRIKDLDKPLPPSDEHAPLSPPSSSTPAPPAPKGSL